MGVGGNEVKLMLRLSHGLLQQNVQKAANYIYTNEEEKKKKKPTKRRFSLTMLKLGCLQLKQKNKDVHMWISKFTQDTSQKITLCQKR